MLGACIFCPVGLRINDRILVCLLQTQNRNKIEGRKSSRLMHAFGTTHVAAPGAAYGFQDSHILHGKTDFLFYFNSSCCA